MSIYKFKDFVPKIAKNVFIADSADVIGEVEIQEDANIWFNVVIRGDVNKISIGENTNIQDLSMLHVTEENDLKIGKNVTIGHSVILHACEIKEGCLIGMGAKVLDGAVIGKNSLVAAGSVVPPGKSYPDNSFIVGMPARAIRVLEEKEIHMYSNHYKSYVGYAKEFNDENVLVKL